MSDYMDKSFLQEEIRCGYKISADMKHIWAVEMDLIAKLKDVCERNHLRYFLSGGSLLGAVRHQGFIPWDDDADFLMPREDFERLKELASSEFREPYFLQTEESDPDIFMRSFARLRNSNTTHIEHEYIGHTANCGIWIDISILDYIYEDKNRREKQIRKVRYYQRLLYAKTYGIHRNLTEVSKLYWVILNIISSLIPRPWICRKLYSALTSCKDSKYIASFSYHSDRYMPFLFEKNDYRESIQLKFEWLQLPAPVGYDHVLRLQYGEDYMEYPPEDKRMPTHVGTVDPFIPFNSYLLKFNSIVENIKNKTIVVFGAGKMLEYYLRHEGKKYPPEFAVDNNSGKWGTEVLGIPVRQPDAILDVPADNLCLVICSIYYREIAKQLSAMGVEQYYIYVQDKAWL